MKPLVWLLILVCSSFVYAEDLDLNEILMQTTFLVKGPSATGGETTGTAFLLLRPNATQPVAGSVTGFIVLVTASHVFDEMTGDSAAIALRTRDNSGTWTPVWAKFHIRKDGKPLWTGVPNSDVAVMYVAWPTTSAMDTMIPTTFLAGDTELTKAKAGPGIELKVLGYPLGNMNVAAFSILRTGMIASYPLLPTEATKTFLLDFKVFKGNSGGPVYYAPREMQGGATICCPPKFIMGLVSKEALVPGAYSEFQLSLGIIVHASVIKSSIEMLPKPETPEALAMQVPVTLISQ